MTGGSGVTILALGGLLLPMLLKAGYPERRGIGLVTSASALGVLLAPSVPMIMYAVIARVPIEQMFLAGLVPALAPRLGRAVGKPGSAALPTHGRLVFHPPCTLQHGQQLRGGVEQHLAALGFEVRLAGAESHLCCGSAGTYSVLQPELATQLRDRKLGHLAPQDDETVISANIGCIQHLQSGTATPVRHWVEVLDDALNRG
jgi:hypothetical protein